MHDFLKKFPFSLIVVIAYIAIGILFDLWHPTWLLFLLIPAYYMLVWSLGKKDDGGSTQEVLRRFPFPVLIVVAYLCLGFGFNLWHPGWLVFLLIPLYYSLIPLVKDEQSAPAQEENKE